MDAVLTAMREQAQGSGFSPEQQGFLEKMMTTVLKRAEKAEEELVRLKKEHEDKLAKSEKARQQVVDGKMGRLDSYNGDRKIWSEWSAKFVGHATTVDSTTGDKLTRIMAGYSIDEERLDEADQQRSATVHYCLLMFCKDSALRVVMSFDKNKGFSAFERLKQRCNPRTKARGLAKLSRLISTKFGNKQGGDFR